MPAPLGPLIDASDFYVSVEFGDSIEPPPSRGAI
jgi:hypothetical protein